MAPLISIIVPVYKVEKTLHYCIESILQQTYKNFEVILIDDGSPDKSGEICDKYAEKDERIKVIHKENEGVSSARNTGFDNAKGEYIVCVDSDDYVNESYLQDFIDVLEQHPDVQMLWCGFSIVKDYNRGIIQNVKYDESGVIVESNRSEIMTLHQKWLDASPCTKLYLKKIIDDNNLRMDESLSLGEDLLFNFSYIDCCNSRKIYHTNKCTYYYIRTEEESLVNKFRPNMFEIYKRINDEILRYITKWGIDEEQMGLFYNSVYFSYEYCLKNTFHKNNTASKKEKYALNRKIIQSKRFKTSIKKASCKIRTPLKIAYKLGDYRFVEIVNGAIRFLYKLKNGVI